MFDMSKAFDTIQRGTLFEDLKEMLTIDELNLIHLLLNDVQLAVKLEDKIGKLFESRIGSPQGDAASALFFIIYLAVSLKIAEKRRKSTENKALQVISEHNYAKTPLNDDFCLDQQYADDISWGSTEEKDLQLIEKVVPEVLKERNLLVNESKTEKYKISRNSEQDWKECKLVGSKLGTEEDIKYRKTLANKAICDLKPILQNQKTSKECKIQVFKALVESIFLYNTEIWGLTQKQENEIDVFQRQLLRRIFGFRYTEDKKNWPSNQKLYEITGTKPWSTTIAKRRLSFFGHVCRLPEDSPAQKALKEALKPVKKPRGKSKNTYLATLKKQLKLKVEIH